MAECVLLWGVGGSARALIELVAKQRKWTVYREEPERDTAFPTERVVAIVEARSNAQTAAACELLRERCCDVRILALVEPCVADEASQPMRRFADDCLERPLLENELSARVGRLYYEPPAIVPALEQQGVARVVWGPLELRFDQRVLFIDGTPCELTPRQERLLSRLMRAAGSIVTNDELWLDFGVATPPNLVNIRVHMHALRKRLGPAGALIVTFPSVGYGIGVADRAWGAGRGEHGHRPE
jgi:DNA-binding response OmpR family regulator